MSVLEKAKTLTELNHPLDGQFRLDLQKSLGFREELKYIPLDEVLKIQKLCLKTGEEMQKIDKLPPGQDKLMDRAITLRLFWAEVCLLAVPQIDNAKKSEGKQP